MFTPDRYSFLQLSSGFLGSRHLVLFGTEINDAIYNRSRYLTGLKCGNTYSFLRITGKSKLILMILCA